MKLEMSFLTNWFKNKFEKYLPRFLKRSWFFPLLGFFVVLYIAIATIFGIVGVAYNLVSYNSMDYNATQRLWYDKLIHSGNPNYTHRECEAAVLKLNDCIIIYIISAYIRFPYNQ